MSEMENILHSIWERNMRQTTPFSSEERAEVAEKIQSLERVSAGPWANIRMEHMAEPLSPELLDKKALRPSNEKE